MLTTALIEHILATIPERTIGVLGDLFLDRYLDIDASLSEPSVETGLDAYQVTRVRTYPGAAGTVINNLAALGVGRIVPVSMLGADGEGYELRQELEKLRRVDRSLLVSTSERRTPTYTKPMLSDGGAAPRELNRLDIKNRLPIPAEVESAILRFLDELWASCDVLLVLDQVSEPECGVVTTTVRDRLARLGGSDPVKNVIVDSRERISLFRNATLKPNERECLRAANTSDLTSALLALADRAGKAVVCTNGERGMTVVESGALHAIPGFPVHGPIDIVGAGDSSSAAMACALASGATLLEAASFGNLIASITIQQIGVTGTATPAQVRDRWRQVNGN